MGALSRSETILMIQERGGMLYHNWRASDGVLCQSPIEEDESVDIVCVIFMRGRPNGKYVRKVRDADLPHLLCFPTIKELGLNDSMITDHGLKIIGQLPMLDRLLLVRTRVTDAGIELLQRTLPNCRIVV